jgi:para-aminobenzoate synthetase component 1
VEKLFELESHANVHHLVSTISAKRRDDKNNLDVVTDAFPGGSITGAPKQRAMEIIDELEADSRRAYCGSMGYFDDDGHADFNILIRTIEATADGAVCWGGGGITIDSTADDEYQEILNKVGKILQTPL